MRYHNQAYHISAFNKIKFNPILATILATLILKHIYIVLIKDSKYFIRKFGNHEIDGCVATDPVKPSYDKIEYIYINRDQSNKKGPKAKPQLNNRRLWG